MSHREKSDNAFAISEAIRAKRERKYGLAEDIAALEESLLADIEAFDLDAAERRAQSELHTAHTERTASNEAIDQALQHLFFYLHEFVQQLNIVRPAIPRDYPLLEKYLLSQLAWHEGFADYRTQSQSAGALVELVTFSGTARRIRPARARPAQPIPRTGQALIGRVHSNRRDVAYCEHALIIVGDPDRHWQSRTMPRLHPVRWQSP